MLRAGTPNPSASQKLEGTVVSSGSYEEDASGDAAASVNAGQQPSGYATVVESAATYTFQSRRLRVRALGTSAQRFYRPADSLLPSDFRSLSHMGDFGVSAVLARSTTLAVNQTDVYSSSPLYSLFTPANRTLPLETDVTAPPVAPPPSHYALNDTGSTSYDTTAILRHGLTPRTDLSGTAGWRRTRTVAQTGDRRDLSMYQARGQMAHKLARNTTLIAAYYYRVGNIDDHGLTPLTSTERVPEHGIEAGFEQRRPISRSRHLTLTARLGASRTVMPEVVETGLVRQRRFDQVFGQLGAAYELTRSWVVRGNYQGGVDYVTALTEPISSQNLSAEVGGLLTRRFDVFASAAYSHGESAIRRGTSSFETYTEDVRLRYAVSRSVAAYVEYLRYFYDSDGVLLVPGLPAFIQRTSVRTGLVFRIP